MQIGTDIVAINRIDTALKRHGKRFLQRFLNPSEIAWATKIETIAGLWAAKEATAKALGYGIGKKVTFHDIRISKNRHNKPQITLNPTLKRKFKINSIDVSISHDGGFAIAVVVLI